MSDSILVVSTDSDLVASKVSGAVPGTRPRAAVTGVGTRPTPADTDVIAVGTRPSTTRDTDEATTICGDKAHICLYVFFF
jgi:hypothetical protein